MSENTQNLTTEKTRSKRRWEKAFLTALENTGNVTRAAAAAKIERRTVYQLKDEAADFAAEWNKALELSADLLEEEARRRAVEGLRRKKFTKVGTPIIDPETNIQYEEHEYSDTLLIFLLKGAKPDKYRDNVKHDININFSEASDEELEAFVRG